MTNLRFIYRKVVPNAGAWLVLLSINGLFGQYAVAQTGSSPEDWPRPVVKATRLTNAPVLDGDVRNDCAWAGVVPASGFVQTRPTEGAPASKKTEVFVAYTDTSLWIGVVAHDDRPDTIIVAESRRDSSLDQTDSFQIIIDGLLSRQNGFVFGTNPVGMQYDAQVVKEGTTGSFAGRSGDYDENWDGNWEVRSRVGDFGWSAELEIPFKTLRYGGSDEQTWGINFQRNIRNSNEIVYWAPIGQQNTISRLSKAGSVEGIEVPSQRNLKITPYALAMASRGGAIAGTRTDQEFGVDLKYSLTPSLTLDATYNTDFAQVEVDDVVVNLDRFSIFLPEKRPFFLENAGQFSVGDNREVELFFSRRIGIVAGEQVPIEGGVRLSGKIGAANNVGLLYMQDEGLAGSVSPNDYLVARVSREMGNRASIGAMFVSRDGEGGSGIAAADDNNKTYALDGQVGVGENLLLQSWLAKTSTPGLTENDDAYALKASFNSSTWSSRAYYTKINENFNPEVGFLQRDDYRRGEFFLMRRFRPSAESRLHEIRPHITFRDYWDLSGFLETGFRHYDVHWEFKNGYQVETGYNYRKDGLIEPFEIVDGVFVPAGSYSGGEVQFSFHTDRSAPLSIEMETTAGERFGGDRLVMTPKIQYRAGEAFKAELAFEYSNFDLPVTGGNFTVLLTRLRAAWSFSPKMTLQLVTQYEDKSKRLSTNVRFSLLRTARSGLYVVYNEFDERLPNAMPAQRQFVIKYNYMFDVFR